MAKRVLLVDDSATARMLIRRCIEIGGWADAEFIEAVNGKDALEKIEGQEVDLLVTDLNMPEMDGAEMLREIRKIDRYKDLPCAVVTSTGNEAKEQELREAGATAILSKPISPAVISVLIEKLFGEDYGA